MEKRQSFLCWKCGLVYTLFKNYTPNQKYTVSCPFCNAEAVVDLAPYSVVITHRGEKMVQGKQEYELKMPDVINTQQRKP